MSFVFLPALNKRKAFLRAPFGSVSLLDRSQNAWINVLARWIEFVQLDVPKSKIGRVRKQMEILEWSFESTITSIKQLHGIRRT